MVTKNSNKTRKILVTVFERNGEYEYNTLVPMEVPEDVKNWYDDPESAQKSDCCEYYLNSDEIFVAVSYVPVTEEDYLVLKKYI